MEKIKVLITGIAGASLGTEVLKCLRLCDHYEIYGCDISPLAYGLYEEDFTRTFCIDRSHYIEQILSLCSQYGINVIVPGAEEPTQLLSSHRNALLRQGVVLAGNDPAIISVCSDKTRCFDLLKSLGFSVPHYISVHHLDKLSDLRYPCIIKPSTGSGGSTYVYLAQNVEEARLYVEYLMCNKMIPLVQEYIPHDEGEFTVGTLVCGKAIASIALKRIFNNKLSTLQKSEIGLVSTGYSQGLIDDFAEIRKECETIAIQLGSQGPLNIQGRVKDGKFIPFEINPRFSASTYLRAMAGFNEVDLYIRFLLGESIELPASIRYGYYLRSLTEKYISQGCVK